MAARVRIKDEAAPAAGKAGGFQAPAPIDLAKPLIVRHRPKSLDVVEGQGQLAASLRGVLDRQEAKSFLFIGPRGTGKTTTAYIVAGKVKTAPGDILFVDGAKYTGVDDFRGITDRLRYRPFGGPSKTCIVDECHRLSGNAWDSILTVTEDPPPHLHWVFCTTNASKVPETIKSRCATYHFKLLNDEAMFKALDRILKRENIELADGVAEMIVREANGSARQMITNLAVARSASGQKDAARMLHAAVESDGIIELCRFLAQGRGSWANAMGILAKIDDDPESIRIVACNYFSAAARKATNPKQIGFWLRLMSAFSIPYNQAEGQAPLLLSLGEVLGAFD